MQDKPNEQIKNGNLLKFFKDYWFLIFFIGGTIIAWTNITNSVQQNQEALLRQTDIIEKLQMDVRENERSISGLDNKFITDIAEIKADIKLLLQKK